MTQFTKKPFTFLAEEISSEEVQSNRTLTITIFFILLAAFGLSVIMLSHQYGENNKAELINLREINQ